MAAPFPTSSRWLFGPAPDLHYRAGLLALDLSRPDPARVLPERAVLLRPWHEPSTEALARAKRMLAHSGGEVP